ncbi:hypothetical protein T310_9485 [Rasamsonia emersonii CBS 393.64]|uniref:Uncharacterized protein n=1 Tax=Rasamsonia emersonii (strain ATCC 16479 / CBS 393.64 / IMI 116815) TaxID=1408163 RepID=A0A0F4YG05_RASE3|nr:hypothetical protein T310_9485 [Rasamsonia emersonii CBS 393.64]KKA16871.1 hypothetical protein T310_9485 [Rasamsonia emersonii CBS 393.64]
MKFWDGWEAWEKMVFVIVIVIAFGVLSYSRWRLRKYARAQSYQVAERARGVDLNEMLIDDVPFGARALESGVRVEGIWTPNHNTPSPNTTKSTSTSATSRAAAFGLPFSASSEQLLTETELRCLTYQQQYNASIELLHGERVRGKEIGLDRIVGRSTEDIAILPETLLCFKGKYAWWIVLGIELGALMSREDKDLA